MYKNIRVRSVIYEMLVEVAKKNKKKPEELNELLIEGAFNAKTTTIFKNKTNKPHTHLVANNPQYDKQYDEGEDTSVINRMLYDESDDVRKELM